MEWSDSLATGVESVDKQHRELIIRAPDLNKALELGDDLLVKDMIFFLEEYVVKHFHDEEKLMRQYNYSGYEAQKRAHDCFVKAFTEIKEEFEAEGITKSVKAKLQVHVNSWLIGHIKIMDKNLGEYIQRQNVVSLLEKKESEFDWFLWEEEA